MTGGGSGLGHATALAFAARGAQVVIAGRNIDKGQETVRLIEALPEAYAGQAIFVPTDVSKAADVQAVVEKAVQTYGRLDYACNNAGTNGPAKPLAEVSEEEWDMVLDVDLKGVWLSMKYELLHMVKENSGVIINIASVAGHVGTAFCFCLHRCQAWCYWVNKSGNVRVLQA